MSQRPSRLLKLSTLLVSSRGRRPDVFINRNPRISPSRVAERRHLIVVPNDRNLAIADKIKAAGGRVDNALAEKDAHSLGQSLKELRKLLFTLPKTPDAKNLSSYIDLTPMKVTEMTKTLAQGGDEEEALVAYSLLYDCVNVYGVKVTRDALAATLEALVKARQTKKAYILCRFFSKSTGDKPGASHWHIVMGGLSALSNVDALKKLIRQMTVHGPFPQSRHYRLLLLAMFRQGTTYTEIQSLLHEMREYNIPFETSILASLQKRAPQDVMWASLIDEYRQRQNEKPVPEQVSAWMTGLAETLAVKGKKAFELHLLRLQHKGLYVNGLTMSMILDWAKVASVETLQFLQTVMDVPNMDEHWAIVINNALNKSGIHDALSIYKEAKLSGIKPNATLLRSMIANLTSSRFRESEAMLDMALELLKDLDRDKPATENKASAKDEAIVYNQLLRSLAASPNTKKYYPIATDLLEEMRKRNVTMDAMATTTIAVMLIRSTSSYEEAEEAYELILSKSKKLLDAKGFVAIFNAVCDLEFRIPNLTDKHGRPRTTLPPPSLYYRIMQDMQEQGYPRTKELYTSLIYRHGILASNVKKIADPKRRADGLVKMLDVIETTHHEIDADPNIGLLDGALLTGLLDAYNRVGAMNRVWEIWNLLVAKNEVNNATVSVILDGIGHNKAPEKYEIVITTLDKMDFPWNLRNFNALVECLCRLGRFDAALAFVTDDMANHPHPEMRPDLETMMVITSFALSQPRRVEILKSLKAQFPVLYTILLQDKTFAIGEEREWLLRL